MKERSNKDRYSLEFKLRAVKLKLESGYSLIAVIKELGLTDTKQLREWIKRYKKNGEEGLKNRSPKMRETTRVSRKKKDELEFLRAENALLHYLLEAKKKDDMKQSKT